VFLKEEKIFYKMVYLYTCFYTKF